MTRAYRTWEEYERHTGLPRPRPILEPEPQAVDDLLKKAARKAWQQGYGAALEYASRVLSAHPLRKPSNPYLDVEPEPEPKSEDLSSDEFVRRYGVFLPPSWAEKKGA